MTSIIKLEALSGVYDDGPLCYLLQIDDVCILLDCGWNESFEMGYIEAIKRHVPRLNAVLLTYSDILHVGALPYLVAKCGLKCPIYATLPTSKMAQLSLQDWFLSHKSVEDFTTFDMKDIETAFELVEYVKFGQVINLKGDNGLQIMPLVAGHMIGGALWRITKMGDEEIVYATDFNLRKERHLNACTFEGVGKPNLFITDAYSALHVQPKPKTRDETLGTKLITTLREGGDVMIVIDTAGRVLELAYMLDQLWQNTKSGLTIYNLVLLSHVASTVVDSAKSMIEYMSDKLLHQCETGKPNPFQFSFLRCCHSIAELNTIRSPKVVLTSNLDMECGFSRELFLEWCTDSKNSIIITGRSNERSLGSKLIRMAEAREQRMATSNAVKLTVKRRIRLEGAELEVYRARKKEQEEAEAKLRLENVRRNTRIEQAESSDESDEEYGSLLNRNQNGNLFSKNGAPKEEVDVKPAEVGYEYDIMARFEQSQKTSFFKRNRKQFPMFPHVEEKARWDEYGQVIRPEDYMLVETDTMQPNPLYKLNKQKSEIKDENDESGSDSENEMELWPTKCISYPEKIEVFSKLSYIDFEGRTDIESAKKIIATQIRPKQLVVVHGSAPATRALTEYYQQNANMEKVLAPTLGENVDLTIESHIYQVTLSDPLMSSLAFQPVRDAELCWVDARLKRRKINNATEFTALDISGSEDIQIIESQEQNNQQETDINETAEQQIVHDENAMDVDEVAESTPNPVRMNTDEQIDQLCLEILPSNNIPSHEAVFVNDPKLSDLRVYLNKAGLSAEFSAGMLYVNDAMRISRNAAGKFHIEGPASEEFYRIQFVLYSQFAIV
ncbi:Cleavage and polyadenylation specificity factor subunit 2 [Aphelenchoides bicaudatus]|nr:Cleavage and polyadenylation specificity factor subunit 2 [Aphelenchoides bicaudatus]